MTTKDNNQNNWIILMILRSMFIFYFKARKLLFNKIYSTDTKQMCTN